MASTQKGGQKVIARMYFVSPCDSERYCLRLLLLHIQGPTSFESLRTVDGHVVPTFKEACILHNLLADDTEWDRVMEEATAFQMPSQLRSIFATICLHCEPRSPLQLWEAHKEAMAEDYLHSEDIVGPAAELKALQHIESILVQNGLSCKDLGLPNVESIDPYDQQFDLTDDLNTVNRQMPLLNDEQKMLVDAILQALDEIKQEVAQCRAYFLDGPGGSGKTMIYNTLIAYMHTQHLNVASSAWTGIAATLFNWWPYCT